MRVDDRDHHRGVACGVEVVERADTLPGLLRVVEDRGDARSRPLASADRAQAEAARRLAADREHGAPRHRLALVVAGGGGLLVGAVRAVLLVGSVSHGRAGPGDRSLLSRRPRPTRSRSPSAAACARAAAASAAGDIRPGAALAQGRPSPPRDRGWRRRPPPAPPPATGPARCRRAPRAVGVRDRAQSEIRSRQLAHRLEVAEAGQALEAERVEVVAGEQREVAVDAARGSRGSP